MNRKEWDDMIELAKLGALPHQGDEQYSLDGYWIDYKQQPVKKVCTCGTTITMGDKDHIDFHSPWCDLKEDKKKIILPKGVTIESSGI